MASLTLDDLTFDNRFTDDLPADPVDLNQPRQVHHAAFSRVAPKPTAAPRLLSMTSRLSVLGSRAPSATS